MMAALLDIGSAPGVDQSAALAQNALLAARLRDYADLLDEQDAGPFRPRAYRRAAETVEQLRRPVSDVLAAEGRQGLDRLPGVGPRIAAALAELVLTGRWSQLERLRGQI